MHAIRYYLSQGVRVHERAEDFYIATVRDEFKANRTIATFLGLLNEPKTAQELTIGLQRLIRDASEAVVKPLVDQFLQDLHRLEVVRQEGEPDIAPITPYYEAGARLGPYLITDLLSQHNHLVQLYRATEGDSGRMVVLKIFAPAPEATGANPRLSSALRQFEQEFDIMRALSPHPCLGVLLAYHTQPHPYAVMEYLPGGSLSECLRNGTLRADSKAYLATQILSALAHLHANGVVHGDIHASNFMVSGDRVAMIDFGFSYRVGLSAAAQNTDGGGVPTYLAPERIREHSYEFSKQPADFRAEVYQIALVLFKLYHGQLPFVGNTWRERAASITTYDFGLHLSPGVPHEQVLLHALQKDPLARYADARELLAAWQQALLVENQAEYTPAS
ncbi:serine/threonine-protein kinase [Hymenobacter sp. BT770]|uniref:serine/threonine-protein kinase n=1 Tax=Hymenobacter sp. BT770 TaxID=2886942 RepID=UPI001D1175AB|nr:serine/threonine-protein kinase [Hymenobacter sp. BT770]MCC3153192.1 serine/threonine protein kinase [Hymenobacter sp. BT770]MDO3415334.1 serine/threonine-protein kinase [Hymenobacter sp. BT770]